MKYTKLCRQLGDNEAELVFFLFIVWFVGIHNIAQAVIILTPVLKT